MAPCSPTLRVAVPGVGHIGSAFAFQLAGKGDHDVSVVARRSSMSKSMDTRNKFTKRMVHKAMSLVSVTRFRSRSIRFLPFFAFHAHRAIVQLRDAEGYLAGGVKRDRDFAFWTMSVWRDESTMRIYFASGAHGKAMPHLRDWGVEASVVRWVQEGEALPEWQYAIEQMRNAGRASKLLHPGPNHADLSYAEPVTVFARQL